MEKDETTQILELTRENNKILRSMRRSNRINSFIRYIYWIIIIGSAASAYYYLQPYINQLLLIYNDLNSSVSSIKDKANGLPDVKNMNLPPELLKQLDSLLKNK